MHPADRFIKYHAGPLFVVRACVICGYVLKMRKLPPGRAGRGWGFREGNIQRGEMIQHIKSAHPDKLTQEA